jgi:predicted DNA-binding ribbon-helix-helix protein
MLKRHEQSAPLDMMETSSRVFQKDGQRLSIRLENIYWDQLEDIAETDAISLNSLIFRISGDLASGVNKTAALRTYCVYRMRQEMVLTSIRTGNIDLAAIITACPQPVMVLTPERRIAAYNPAFVSDILARGSEKGDKAQKTPLRLTFSRPFNQIIRQVVDNPRTIISGQIGFTVGDRHTQRRVRYALADRSRGEESFIVAFVETAPEGTLRD